MALADTSGALCAYLNLPDGASTTTIESKTSFLRAVTAGHIDAVSRPLQRVRRIIVVETDLIDHETRLVARVTQRRLSSRRLSSFQPKMHHRDVDALRHSLVSPSRKLISLPESDRSREISPWFWTTLTEPGATLKRAGERYERQEPDPNANARAS